MNLRDVVRDNPRLKAVVGDVVDGFEPYLAERPNARIHWVEEYARSSVHGSAHRAGIAAITNDSVVLSWKHGLMYRNRSTFELRRADVSSWELDDEGLVAETADGRVSVRFRPGSAELAAFSERFELIRPFGRR